MQMSSTESFPTAAIVSFRGFTGAQRSKETLLTEEENVDFFFDFLKIVLIDLNIMLMDS